MWMAVATPVSGRGEDGGLGHQPAEWADPDYIAGSVKNNVWAETKPRILGFGRGAVYTEIADDDDLRWVERWTY